MGRKQTKKILFFSSQITLQRIESYVKRVQLTYPHQVKRFLQNLQKSIHTNYELQLREFCFI